MPELDFAGLRDTVEEAVRQPEFPAVERRTGRLRLRRRIAVSAVAAAVVAAGAIGYAIRPHDRVALPPANPKPVGDVVEVMAGDPDHLYLRTAEGCPAVISSTECRLHVYASESAGRTWREVTLPPGTDELAGVLGPQVLLAQRRSREPIVPQVSTDGGRTWQLMAGPLGAQTIQAVPAGLRPWGCLGSGPTGPCQVMAVSPSLLRAGPLAKQPPLDAADVQGLPGAGLWVTGHDRTLAHRPALAWSTDGGTSWRTHVFTDAPPSTATVGLGGWPTVHTLDGRTVYARLLDETTGTYRTYRTADGGATWALVDATSQDGGWELVAGDGALVVRDGDNTGRYLASRDGKPFGAATVTGLPPDAGAVSNAMHGRYVATAESDRKGIYVSDDGYVWRRIALS